MSLQRVKEYFEIYGIEERIIELTTSSATVELAAEALHCEPERIAKSLAFQLEDKVILVVTAGDGKINNGKFKKQFGIKAKMVSYEEVETKVGHAAGGVCPFGINEDVDVYLDLSLKRFNTVFPACGNSNSAIELSIPELEMYSEYKEWVDVCKDWEE